MIRDTIKETSFLELLKMGREPKKALEQKTERKPALFAPDCISRNGKYYLYFCTDDDSEGVAVSDRPECPFGDARQLPCGGIDPAVFVDRDGQAYYYWDQIHARGVPLNEDMVSFDSNKIVGNLVTEEEHYFHEGSSLRRIGNTYYYIFADVERGRPTSLGYATSDTPLGPFRYRGIIIDNAECDPKSWNNHGSIEYFRGQWYVCYHRSTRNSRTRRRLCMEKIEILEDGTIPEVKMTSQGIGKPFTAGEKIWGYQACGLRGKVFIDTDEVYGEKLTGIHRRDEMIFRYLQGKPIYRHVKLETRGSGELEILLDGRGVTKLEITENQPVSETNFSMEGFATKEEGYEVKLFCKRSRKLQILSITFFE